MILKADETDIETAEREALALKQEGGKSLTVNANGNNVALIAWRKSGGPLLPLVLTRMEARRLAALLYDAAAEADLWK
jgi:hypothetical protein